MGVGCRSGEGKVPSGNVQDLAFTQNDHDRANHSRTAFSLLGFPRLIRLEKITKKSQKFDFPTGKIQLKSHEGLN